MPKIPRPQKARRLNDIFVPQIPRFRRRGGLEFFVGFSGFAFYVIISENCTVLREKCFAGLKQNPGEPVTKPFESARTNQEPNSKYKASFLPHPRSLKFHGVRK